MVFVKFQDLEMYTRIHCNNCKKPIIALFEYNCCSSECEDEFKKRNCEENDNGTNIIIRKKDYEHLKKELIKE